MEDAWDAARGGRHPAPGLHRLRLRGPAVADPDPPRPRGRRRRHEHCRATPRHVIGEVLSTRKVGAFCHLTLVAPGVPDRFRPGNFVALRPALYRLARRAMWIHLGQAHRRVRRHHRAGRRAGGPRHPLVGRPAERGAGRGHRARSGVPSPSPRSRSAKPSSSARATPPHRCSPSPSGSASATVRSPWSSPPRTRPTCSRHSKRDAPHARSPWSPATGRSAVAAPWPTCSPTCWARLGPRSSTPPGPRPPFTPSHRPPSRPERGARPPSSSRWPAAPACARAARCRSWARTESPGMVRACVEGPVFRGDRVRWDDVEPGVRVGSA